MNTNNFYKNLKQIDDFSKIMQDSNYSLIPNDWYVIVSDIKNSTKAIENGMYKQVNFVAALTIIGILNIDKEEDFPYVFGGDGASLLIPPSLVEKSKKVLIEASKKAKEAFDLELRIGVISIKEIEKRGCFIEITKLQITNDYAQAIIRGNGLELAEELLKKEYERSLDLKEYTKEIAYEIIAKRIQQYPQIASELIAFNKTNTTITKDVMKYKFNRKKIE